MPRIILEIGADASQANSELQKMAGNFDEVNSESKKFTTETNKGLKDVSESAKKANEELANPKPTDNQKKQISLLQQLKAEIKAAQSAALAAGEGTAEWARQLAIAGNKKADLKDLQEAVAALDPDAIAGGFLRLGSSAAGGFAVAQGAIALVGNESKNLEKALLKVQAAQAVLAGLQELANAKDEIGKVRLIILNKLQTFELNRQAVAMEKQIALTGIESTEVAALAAAQKAETAAIEGTTIAQRILNAAVKSNPILFFVSAIAVLVIAISEWNNSTQLAIDLERINSKAIDGTIIKSKDLRDAYNEQVIALTELQAKYDVLNGTQTEVGASVAVLAIKHKLAIEEINKNTQTELAKFRSTLIFENKGSRDEIARISKEGNDKALAENIRFSTAKQVLQQEANIKETEANKKKEIDRLKGVKDDADKEAEKRKQAYEKLLGLQKDFNQASLDLSRRVRQGEIDAAKGVEKVKLQEAEALIEIDILRKTLEEKSRLASKGSKLSLEQENQFAILKNQILLKSGQEQIDIEKAIDEKKSSDEKAALDKKQAEAEKAFTDELKRIEDHGKAATLKTKEGSVERLNAEIESIQAEADFRKTQAGLTADEVFIIEQEALKKITDLRKEISKKEGFSWAKLLGVTDADLEEIKKGLTSILNSTKQIVDQQLAVEQAALDKRKEINEETISSSESRISELQTQLALELDLNKQGFASNVQAVQDALAQENAARDEALQEQKQIAIEEEEIKKKQAAVEALTQVSALLTAGAVLFSKEVAKGGIVGVVTAIAGIAAMVAAFASLKAKLNAAGFKEGGFTGEVGESEVAGVVHGREFVSTAKTTKKHRPLLEALHTENYSGLKFGDLQPILEGAKFNVETLNQIEGEGKIYQQSKNIHAEKMVSLMGVTNKNLSRFFEHVKNKPSQIINLDGSVTTKNGNSSRTIKKQ